MELSLRTEKSVLEDRAAALEIEVARKLDAGRLEIETRVRSQERERTHLPTSKTVLHPTPGAPQRTNGFPETIALSPDGRYAALLNNGYGSAESGTKQ